MLHWSVRKLESGYTQAEMAVIVLIIGILAAIAMPNFSVWLRQRQVDAAFNQIAAAIEETQNESIKRSTACRLQIPATGPNPTFTGSCLLTGPFTLDDRMVLDHTRRPNSWFISFNANGENRSPNEAGTLWLKDSENDTIRSKCLVISVGIGLRRTGERVNGSCLTPSSGE